jgi:DNA repair exonuclease SbcCD ATPase subunit
MQGRYNFIKIHKVIFHDFSLYYKDGKVVKVDENINDGVYCLAGANGLGKTTFLNAINYGLTGIVLEPNKEVLSPDDIIKSNKSYTERYFQGRIRAEHKDTAEIELLLSVNGRSIRIIRSFSDRDGIRLFEYYEEKGGKVINLLNTANLSPKQLLDLYEDAIVKEVGIGKFAYYIFFQLYVLTFDENRRMLFWDERASTNALSIAFNDDLKDTEKVLKLKKQMEELESYGRNTRWQATQLKNEIDKLINTRSEMADEGYQMLEAEYFELIANIDRLTQTHSDVDTEYDTLLKRQNITNSEILQLKISYKRLFSQYTEPRSNLLNNPYVQLAKKENKCFLCSAEGHHVIESIEKKLYTYNTCPACDTALNNDNADVQQHLLDSIKKIDKDLEVKNKDLEELMFESETKKVELDKAYIELDRLKTKLKRFEKENSGISFTRTGDAPTDTLIDEYNRQYEKLDKAAKDYYEKRDALTPEYKNLQSKVNKGYKQAENIFVPLFKQFARSFIGLDLNVFPKIKGKDIILVFEMKNTARTAAHQLSESQRFFLDIALRMALAVHLANKSTPATLFIDTPEGSLDIAYENRVGKMFSEFVKDYHQNIVMTANINASQLLISLAENCGDKKMKFRRMLEWTELSEIQKEGEYLFNSVYSNIEAALKKPKPNK